MALVAAELATELAHLEPRWTLLGTDLDTVSLDAARAGRYAIEDLGNLPDRLREQLISAGRPGTPRREIPAALRQHVEFRHIDLARADWQPPQEAPFDAIFLSNVLIYFDRATQERVLKNVAGCLRPDGIVFTSRIEGNLGLATRQLKAAGNCTYITARMARRV
jgi:chemotaxis protein methyltransferase CheR